MGKCRNCHIEVLDETEFCPLCMSILEPDGEMENMYPNVRVRMRRLKIFSRIYLFLAICIEAALVTINVFDRHEIWWSAIVGLTLLYFYLLLHHTILGKSGYRSKIIVASTFAVLMAIGIDFISGYRGWSVDYVLPIGILVVDGIVLGCMICNRRSWQSYMMWQIFMILCSLIPTGLYLAELEHNPVMAFLPLAASAAIFLGTLIIGDRRARKELLRRVHI